MRLAVTGANGFVGRYVVSEALRGGHDVVAVVRPQADLSALAWHDHPAVTVVRDDLRRPTDLPGGLAGVDAVVHLAAVKGGDFAEQFAGTVVGTENLLAGMGEAGLDRLVLVSSFSVYDHRRPPRGVAFDESVPLAADPLVRDDYARTKLLQEELVSRFAVDGGRVTVVRPGIVYGRGELWHACLGAGLGGAFLLVGPRGRMPLTYVENAAAAIVLAATVDRAVGQTVNIVDDDQPTRDTFARFVGDHDPDPPRLVPVPWPVLRGLATLAWAVRERLVGGQAQLPGLLVPARLEARFGSRRYSNDRARRVLGWVPVHRWDTAVLRSLGSDDLLAVPVVR